MSSGITLKVPPHIGSWLESTGHHGISFFSAQTAELRQLLPHLGGKLAVDVELPGSCFLGKQMPCLSTRQLESLETVVWRPRVQLCVVIQVVLPGKPSLNVKATK